MKRILIVEDNEMNLLLATQILEDDYEILDAGDGVEAVAKAKIELPDLILMDLSLPKMDGWEATRRIKEDPTTSHIPIIALTAHAIKGDYERAIEAGCNAYLTKPIRDELLLSEVAEWLNK